MSTDDRQNFANTGLPSDTTQPSDNTQRGADILDDVAGMQSRRKFLRTAIISGVGVATVAATAGVATIASQNAPSVFAQNSGEASCTTCFEDTGFDTISNNTFTYNHTSGNTNPGDFFLWFTVHNLPPDTYTISISPELAHTASNPFEYTGSNSAKLYKRAANTADDCPSFQDDKLPTDQVEQADSVSLLSPYTITGSNADLQLVIHFGFDGKLTTGDHDYTFTLTMQGTNQSHGCSKDVVLHAEQK